jgi:archaemetzincin
MEPIFVWWIGDEEADPELMEHVRLHLSRAFGRPTVRWDGNGRPRHAFDPRRKHASGAILAGCSRQGRPQAWSSA